MSLLLLPLFRFVLARRYNIMITGLEHLQKDGSKMIMPNHPGLIDPIIIFSHLSKYIPLSPVVTDTYYNKPILRTLFQQVQAVPMGDLQRGTGGSDAVSATFSGIVDGLIGGKNILLYPSGQIYSQDFESVIGKKSVYEIITGLNKRTNSGIQESPENGGNLYENHLTKGDVRRSTMNKESEDGMQSSQFTEIPIRFIAVQTKGVWGSTFSKAWDGTNPAFFKVFFQSVGIIIINGIFFVPKRKVTITIEDFTDKLQEITKEHTRNIEGTRNTLNNTLESFYNAKKEPKNTYTPHFWFWNNVKTKIVPENIEGSLVSLQSTNTLTRENIPDDIWEIVISEVARIKSIPKENITLQGNFILDYYFNVVGSKPRDFSPIVTILSSSISSYSRKSIGNIEKLPMSHTTVGTT